MRVVLQNASVFSGGGCAVRDLALIDGVFASPADDVSVLDLSSFTVFPGFADVHVHFREPGFSYKETIRTGSKAAARGGYTDVCTMPNLDPAPDDAAHLAAQEAVIARDACVHVHPYGTITRGEQGRELSDMDALAGRVVAFSDDGRGVQDGERMRDAMRKAKSLGKIIAAHCEDNALLRGGYIHDGAYAKAHGHRGICSASEYEQVSRDLRLAAETGCSYHVCHISTKESVRLIRDAKRAGVDVTCETAPHYLLLTENDLQEDGRFKMNPPLRTEADRDALLEGLCDGTIDMIATDHAPHTAAEKGRGLEKSLMGVVGLETAFPLLYTFLVRTGVISLEKLVALLHDNPCRRFSVGNPIETGQAANCTVFDLHSAYTIDPADFVSKGKSTPFAGVTVYGKCIYTFCDGAFAWNGGQTNGKENGHS